jgi:hypothetical protein
MGIYIIADDQFWTTASRGQSWFVPLLHKVLQKKVADFRMFELFCSFCRPPAIFFSVFLAGGLAI